MIVHDAEAEDLVELGAAGNVTLRVNPALVETDLVVTVTAAETVLHGGPAALLDASGRESLRAAGALSLLETSASQGWRLAVELERLLTLRVPTIGVSLVLNLPQVAGSFAGYPHDDEAMQRLLRSRVRRLFQVAPGRVRQRVLERLPRELTAAAVFGGPPSVAHTEALLRGTVFKGAELPEQLDALVIGVPPTTPWVPRERPNPVSAAYLALGPALGSGATRRRSCRAAPRSSCTRSRGASRVPTQSPYRALFFDPRTARDSDAMREAERRRARGRGRDQRVPRRARGASAAAVRRMERVRRDRAPPRRGARRRLPRLGRRRASSDTSRCTASPPRSRWRADAAPRGSATCSRRRTSRSSCRARSVYTSRPASTPRYTATSPAAHEPSTLAAASATSRCSDNV